MTDKTSAEVARELADERGRIADTVDELKHRVSIGHAIDSLIGSLGEGGGRYGRSLGRSVSENPIPLALVGVGLAWLMSGASGRPGMPRGNGGPRHHDRYGEEGDGRSYGSASYAYPSDEDPYADIYDDPYYDDLVYDADVYERDPATGAPYGSAARVMSREDRESGVGSTAHEARERASGAAASARAGASSAAHRASESMSSAGNRAKATASGAAGATSERYAAARARASDAARHARDRAHEARMRLEQAGRSCARRAGAMGRRALAGAEDFVHENPLAAGAIAMAVGAAVGGAIRNTRFENEWMGESSENLRHRAADIAVEEARKARRVAEAAASEAQRVYEETRHEAAGQMPRADEAVREAERRAEDAASRVAEAGRIEAERQRLGDPRTD